MADCRCRKKIAAVVTWYTPGSHSDVLVGKFLPGRGIALDDGFHELRVDLVSLYIDQVPTKRSGGDPKMNDIGVGLAEAHGVEIYESMREVVWPTRHFAAITVPAVSSPSMV